MRFEQQVARVTGTAPGIGRALVQRFVTEGAAVVAVGFVRVLRYALVAELEQQETKVTGGVTHVASNTDVASLLTTTTSLYGYLAILCTNTGMLDLLAPAADVPLDFCERVLSIHLYGPVLACRRATPLFLEQYKGFPRSLAS